MPFDFDSGVAKKKSGDAPAFDFTAAQPEKQIDAPFPEQEEGGILSEAADRVETAGKHVVKSTSRMFTAIPKSIAIQHDERKVLDAFDKLDAGESLPSDLTTIMLDETMLYRMSDAAGKAELRAKYSRDASPKEKELYKAGEAADTFMEEALPTDKKYDQDFFTAKVPQGVGSMLGFMGQGMLLRRPITSMGAPRAAAGAAGAAAGGSLVGGVEGFEDALNNGATIDQAFESSKLNSYLGITEAVPITQLLNRLDKGTGGTVSTTIKNMLKEGTEEAIQEGFQQIMGNVIASDIVGYDEGRDLIEGAEEGAAVGFTTGALVSFLTSMVAGRRGTSRGSKQAADETGEQATAAHVENIQNAESVDEAIQAAEAATATEATPEGDDLLDQLNKMAGVDEKPQVDLPEETDAEAAPEAEVTPADVNRPMINADEATLEKFVGMGNKVAIKEKEIRESEATTEKPEVEVVAPDVITMEKVKGGGLNVAGKGAREALKESGISFVPRKGGGAVVSKKNAKAARRVISPLTEEGQQKALVRSEKAKARSEKAKAPDAERDSAAVFLAKSGGVRDDEGHDLINTLDGFERPFGVSGIVREDSPNSLADAAEKLREANYPVGERDEDIIPILSDDIQGKKAYTPAGNDRIAEQEQAEVDAKQQAEDGLAIEEMGGEAHIEQEAAASDAYLDQVESAGADGYVFVDGDFFPSEAQDINDLQEEDKAYEEYNIEAEQGKEADGRTSEEDGKQVGQDHRAEVRGDLPGQETSAAVEEKEIWQKTRHEYNIEGAKKTKPGTVDSSEIEHAIAVRQAVKDGKPVPAEVLADYPELAKPDVRLQKKSEREAAPGQQKLVEGEKPKVSDEAIKLKPGQNKEIDKHDPQSLFGAAERAEAAEAQPDLFAAEEKPKTEPTESIDKLNAEYSRLADIRHRIKTKEITNKEGLKEAGVKRRIDLERAIDTAKEAIAAAKAAPTTVEDAVADTNAKTAETLAKVADKLDVVVARVEKLNEAPEHAGRQGKPLAENEVYDKTATGSSKVKVDVDGSTVPIEMNVADFREATDEWAALFEDPQEKVMIHKKVADSYLTKAEADKVIDGWKLHVNEQFKNNRSENSDKTVLSLFDLSGEWSKPWEEAGYNVIRFDIQSGQDIHDFSVEYFNDNWDFGEVYAILAACPCTDFASSGARHFAGKDADGRTEISKALVMRTLETIEYFRPKIWALENPVGRIERLTGLPKARLTFDPHHFGEDYTKKTILWGKFNADLPTANVEPTAGSKMHTQFGGKSQATKNARSVTPEGFAYSFFMANNYIDMPVEQKLMADYPEVSGAVKTALAAGVSEKEINDLMEYTYGNDEFDEAIEELVKATAEKKGVAMPASPEKPATTETVEDKGAPASPENLYPWQMTKAEWVGGRAGVDEVAIFQAAHANHVKEAVAAGKDVPQNVLEDYKSNHWAQKAMGAEFPKEAALKAGQKKNATLLDLLDEYKTLRKQRYLSKGMQEREAGVASDFAEKDLINAMKNVKDKVSYVKAEIEDFEKDTAKEQGDSDKLASITVDGVPQDVAEPETQRRLKEKLAGQRAEKEPYSLDSHKTIMKRTYAGDDVTAEEFKRAFNKLLENEAGLKKEMAVMTKAAIMNLHGDMFGYRNKNERKSEVVDAAYRQMITDFTLGETYSYSFGEDANAGAIRVVEDFTDESLAEFGEGRKKALEEQKQQMKERVAGASDPKTIEDFKNYLRINAKEGDKFRDVFMTLTPEQRALFDTLAAEESRSNRKTRTEHQRSEVQYTGVTTGTEIIETKHTQKGYDLFVVVPEERVEKDVYRAWNAAAKKMGGWYSRYRGQGATPGFQFKDRDSAEAFQAYVTGGDSSAVKEQAKERRSAFEDDRSQTAAERLNNMADTLEERGNEKLNQDRKTNTARRAGMAANAIADAEANISLAKTMRNIAGAIEDGKAKMLDKVRQKIQVEALRGYVSRGNSDYIRSKYDGYTEQEKHKYDPATIEAADHATFPAYTMYRSDLASLGRKLIDKDGTKLLGKRILTVADDVTKEYLKFAKENLDRVGTFVRTDGSRAVFKSKPMAEKSIKGSGFKGRAIVLPFKRGQNIIIMSPAEAQKAGIWEGDDKRITLRADFGDDITMKAGEDTPWQFKTAHHQRQLFARMGIETAAEFRAALREYIEFSVPQKAPDKIKVKERSMIGRKNDGMDFFPTPEAIADEMVTTADIQEGMKVLEPSAGWGHIAERIRESGVEPDVIELSGDRRELLELKGFNVVDSDFMEHNEPGYDRIIMNPPFSDRRDMEHVKHAYDLLKPGGRMVAIMGEGVFFGSDKKATGFREWLDSVGGTDEKMEEGTFKDVNLPVNTGVNSRMVVIDKPESGQPLYSKTDNVVSEPFSVADAKTELRKDKRLSKLMDTGKLVVVEDESGIPAGAELFHAAYHGTPHDFDAFTTEVIGEGQGAQAFGHGMYFASNKAVAEYYRDNIKDIAPVNEINDRINAQYQIMKKYERPGYRKFTDQKGHDATREYDRLMDERSDIVKNVYNAPGKMYEVELAPAEDEYLLWDKPIGDQSENVLESLRKHGKQVHTKHLETIDYTLTGEELYEYYIDNFKSPQAASEYMHSIGIRGIKYLDGFSRTKGDGGYNYVIFSDDDVSITAKYSKAVGTQGAYLDGKAYVVASNNTKEGVTGVAWHEVTHAAMDQAGSAVEFLGEKQHAQLMKRLSTIYKMAENGSGSVNEFFQQAYNRIPAATLTDTQLDELAGYTVERYVNEPKTVPQSVVKWVKDFIAAVKAAIFRRFNVLIGELKPQDLMAIAKAYASFEVRKAAGGAESGAGRGIAPTLAMASEQAGTFYSQLQRVLAQKLPGKGAPKQLAVQIQSMAKKGDFKAEELEWSGVVEWLNSQSAADGKVTKDQVIDFLKANEIQVAKRMYEDDKSMRYIARFLERDHKTISRWMDAEGVDKRVYFRDKITKAETVSLYATGKSQQEIAVKLGVQQATVGHWLRNADVEMRGKSYQHAVVESVVRMYIDEEVSAASVGDSMGIPTASVMKILRNEGATRTRSEAAAIRSIDYVPTSRIGGIMLSWNSPKAGGWVLAHSRLEASRMAELDADDSVESWTRDVERIKYIAPDGTKHTYIPDFAVTYINGDQVIEEVKSSSFINDPVVVSKSKAAEKHFNEKGIEYKTLTEKDISPSSDTLDKTMQGQPLFSKKDQGEIEFTKEGEVMPSEWDFNETWRERLDAEMLYKFNRLRKMQDVTFEGKTVPDHANVAEMEALFYGKAGEDFDVIERKHIKPALKAIEAKKLDLNLDDLDRFMLAKHAPERNAFVRRIDPDNEMGSGITDVRAEDILSGFTENQTDALEEAAGHIRALLDHRLDMMVEFGLEKQVHVDNLRGIFTDYIPLRGNDEDESLLHAMTGKKFDIRGKEDRHHVTGRHTEPTDMIAHAVAMAEATAIRARKAEVGKAIANLYMANPDPAVWELNKVTMKKYISKSGESFDGAEKQASFLDKKETTKDGQVVYRVDPAWKQADNVFAFKVNGEQFFLTLHDVAMARQLKGLGVNRSGLIINMLGALNRYLAMINTSLAPGFALTNPMRDVQTALLNLQAHGEKIEGLADPDKMMAGVKRDVLKNWGASFAAVLKYELERPETARLSKRWDEMRESGGKIAFYSMQDIGSLRKRLARQLSLAKGKNIPKSVFITMAQYIMGTNAAIENSVRLATYDALRERGVNKQNAAYIVRNLTVDFNRKGESGQLANALFLFYNASIQGSRIVYNASKMMLKDKKGRAVLAGMVATGFMLAEWSRMAMGEDDDGEDEWDKIKDYNKQRNLILPLQGEGDDFNKFMLPYGFNIFINLGYWINDLYHYTESGGQKGKSPIHVSMEMVKTVLGSFNPLGTNVPLPTVSLPMYELAINENYAGRMINKPENPYADYKEPDSGRVFKSLENSWEHDLAKALNNMTGGDDFKPGVIDVAPGTIKYMMGWLTGGMGTFIGSMADLPTIEGDIEPYQIPLVRKVIGGAPDYRAVQEYRENIENPLRRLDQYNKAKGAEKTALRKQYGKEIQLGLYAKDTEAAMRKYYKRRKTTPKSKVEGINDEMRKLAVRFNTRHHDIMGAE